MMLSSALASSKMDENLLSEHEDYPGGHPKEADKEQGDDDGFQEFQEAVVRRDSSAIKENFLIQ